MRKRSLLVCMLVCCSVLFGCGNKTEVDVNVPKTETVQDVQQDNRDKASSIVESIFKPFEEDGYTVNYYVSKNAITIGMTNDDIVTIIDYSISYGEPQEVKNLFEQLTKGLHDKLVTELEKEGLDYTIYLELEDENGNAYAGYNGVLYYDRLN